MSRTPLALAPAQLTRARNAVAVAFALNGFGIATWMARIPAVRDHLDLRPSQLGAVLLAIALGCVVALPTSGLIVGAIGAARTVYAGALLANSGLVVAGLAAEVFENVVVTFVSLFACGYGVAAWDVAMNVEGAAVERELDRSIMPRFHAAWSLGTVAAAGLGAAAAALDVGVTAHFAIVGLIALTFTCVAARGFLPLAAQRDDDDAPSAAASVWAAWREPRTLLIGVMLLCFGLVEGIANDWVAVGIVDGYDVDNAVGAVAFGVFVVAMTAARTVGTALIDRFGRLRVLRSGAAVAVAGVMLVVFGASLPVAVAGIVLWGLGCALGFPVGMSAAADDPQHAASRVSVVASIGYTAFLAGPPALGWLGDHEGVLRSLLVAAAAAAVAAAVAPAARPRGHDELNEERFEDPRRA